MVVIRKLVGHKVRFNEYILSPQLSVFKML